MIDRIWRVVLVLSAVLVVGGIVHIVSVLMLPWLAPNDAFARISLIGPPNVMEFLGRADAPDNKMPFRDPAVASAICRYDLEQGSLRVIASVSEQASIALSFHSRFGLPFYGLTDRASNDGKLDVLLMTATQLEKAESEDVEGEPLHDIRVVAPHIEGFVEFDALARVGGYAMAEQALRSVSCKIERHL